MASADTTASIIEQAAEWAVEAAHGDMPLESRAMLGAWLAADRRHEGAYVRACAWLRATEDAVVGAHSAKDSLPTQDQQVAAPAGRPLISYNDNEGYNRSAPHAGDGQSPGTPRRLFRWTGRLAIGGALAASVAMLLGIGMPAITSFWQGSAGPSGASAVEIVQLRDGSVARLSRDARIQVVLSDEARSITLLSGEATFDVAPDESRPFVVQAGQVFAQAVGTVYSVSRVGQSGGTVEVSEGTVLVWPRDERDQAVRLVAGGKVTLDPGPLTTQRSTTSQSRLAAPVIAQISLDNVTIASAVQRFNRVNRTKIIISDPEIGEVRIIGHYNANDPYQFAESASVIVDGYIERENGNIVLKLK